MSHDMEGAVLNKEDRFVHRFGLTSEICEHKSVNDVECDSTTPVIERVCDPPIGLMTDEANNRIMSLLKEAIKKYEIDVSAGSLWETCIKKDILASLIAQCCFLVTIFLNESKYKYQSVAEFSLLFPWLLLNGYTKMMIKRIRSTRASERVKNILNSFKNDIGAVLHFELEQKRFSFDPPNSLLIPVYRDREWKRLPTNALVVGDVFKLQIGDSYPCDCRLILNCDRDGSIQVDSKLLKRGEVYEIVGEMSPDVEPVDGVFVAQTDSLLPQLEAFLEAKFRHKDRTSSFNAESGDPNHEDKNGKRFKMCKNHTENLQMCNTNSVWDLSDTTQFSKLDVSNLQLCIYITISVLSVVINSVWNGFDRWLSHLGLFARIMICLLFPGVEPVMQLADVWGNVKLQSLFHWHNEKRSMMDICPQQSSSSSTLMSGSSADSVDSEMAANQIPLMNQLKELTKVFKRGLDSDGSLLKTLSSVTLLCFVDDIGLLTGCATPQEVAVIRGDSITASDSDKNVSRSNTKPALTVKSTKNGNLPKEVLSKDIGGSIYTENLRSELMDNKSAEVSKDIRLSNEDEKVNLYLGSSSKEDTASKENLVILDIFSDSSQYGKQYVKFNNDLERSCLPQLLPLAFAMTVTQFPRYQPPLLFKMAPELIYTYLGMLANDSFRDFTDCLCTLTGSIGLKRSYVRRFRLLRFVVLIDESHGTNGKLLLFFLRDPRKQIVQMVVKGKLEMLLDRNLNYHHQKGDIVAINRIMKRKLKDLSMQWVSSGMVPFAYAYKPIHLDEFNLLMAHLSPTTIYTVKVPKTENRRRRMYMCLEESNPINMRYGGVCVSNFFRHLKHPEDACGDSSSLLRWETVTNEVKLRILKGCVGDMVNACLKNTVMLGMCATKNLYPKEVPNRIQSFHEAGVRFVYFSKHDEKQTRILGGLLGLETSWNSMISLSNSDRSTYVNQDGRIVLPSGIDNIRRHIEDVDDVPLQVSLFCNCNPENIVEMMRILRENGETIMCVGGGLRPSNFYIFSEAHSSVSVALGYHPICRFCRGKRWNGIAKAHIFEEAIPELKFSAALTSLPCDLQNSQMYKVADPYFVMEMLFEVFKEARHMATNIQEAAAFFKLACHAIAWMLALQTFFGFPHILKPLDLGLILFVYIPLISCSLLSNPVADRVMQYMPSRCRNGDGNFKFKSMMKTYPRLCSVTTLALFIHCICLYNVDNAVKADLVARHNIKIEFDHCNSLLAAPRQNCIDMTADLIRSVTTIVETGGQSPAIFIKPETPIEITQMFTSITLLLYYIVASSSWVNKYGTFGSGVLTHYKWILCSVVSVTLQVINVYIRLRFYSISMPEIMAIFPFETIIPLAIGFLLLIVFLGELVKYHNKKDRDIEQKFLQLLFSTRLGMWSPK